MDSDTPVIFTDLDGTLLDLHDYSFDPAEQALTAVRRHNVPVIFCSAKTMPEQIYYREALCLYHPFIVENGGAVFIDQHYFSFAYNYSKTARGFNIIELGSPVSVLNEAIDTVRKKTGMTIRTYREMSRAQICEATDLDPDMAAAASDRHYSQTVVFAENPAIFSQEIRSTGFQCVEGGRFHTVMGANDKGRAVDILKTFYELERKKPVVTIGLGDSQNDIPLLRAVDKPVLVRKKTGAWEDLDLPGLYRTNHPGPAGWNEAVMAILQQQGLGK